MKNWLSRNFVLLLFLLLAIFQVSKLGVGSPFRYDWSWPFFDLKQFWNGLTSDSSFGLFSILSKNGLATFGLFGLVNFSPVIFFKLFIFLIHFTAGYGFYKFIRTRVNSETIAIVSGFAYAFSPYIFIRTIVGFVWSMVAYAALPIFLQKFWQTKKNTLDFLVIGLLLSLIFSQTQAGILVSLIITVHLSTNLFGEDRVHTVRNYFFTFISLLIFVLPWLIVFLFKKQNLTVISGGAVTTLNFIASLPHSFRNMFMLSDHHITAGYFYPLSHNKYYLLGWLIVWLVALCSVCNKKNRDIVLTLIVSSLLVLPFVEGPIGFFGRFYIWFYHHFPQIAVFRETYHFEFLYAISLVVLSALGLDWSWGRIDTIITGSQIKSGMTTPKLTGLLLTSLKAILAASMVVIIWPYLTFNYAGYIKLQQIPQEYTDLYNYFQRNNNVCHKIYYPPGLGFVYFKGDNGLGASNSDLIASSLGIPYVTEGASVLDLPNAEMFYRNELVSQFYDMNDNGQFVSLLNEGSIDCVVVRTDMGTKYKDASNLGKETDPAIVSKWENTDWLDLTRSKQGLKLEKQFGKNVYIFKSETNSNFENSKLKQTGKNATDQFAYNLQLTTYNLPLTDWATDFAYYKDGWSRGRYDFWRKFLFSQLRQDFVYTDKPGSIVSGKIAHDGKYQIWARYLAGGVTGEVELKINDNIFIIEKDADPERFVWKNLGETNTKTGDNVEIKNITGENAIADLVLIK